MLAAARRSTGSTAGLPRCTVAGALTDAGDVTDEDYGDIELDVIELPATTAEEWEAERRRLARQGWLRLVEVEAELRNGRAG
jgi:hypothetical protein